MYWLVFFLLIFMVLVLYDKFYGEKLVNQKRVVTLHYTNWCPACRHMKPIWTAVKKATKSNSIKYVELDEDTMRTVGVESYPTIRMVSEYGKRYEYRGGPNFDSLYRWVLQPMAK